MADGGSARKDKVVLGWIKVSETMCLSLEDACLYMCDCLSHHGKEMASYIVSYVSLRHGSEFDSPCHSVRMSGILNPDASYIPKVQIDD